MEYFNRRFSLKIVSLLSAIVLSLFVQLVGAQISETVPPGARLQLAEEQKQLAGRFSKLEELFLRMSELESTTNPARSGLLQQAAKQSKELSTTQRMAMASELLTRQQYTRAIQEQQTSHDNLKKLLELLQSENREKRIREERVKYEEIIKEIQRIRRIQQSISGRSENAERTKETAKDQGDLADQADKIAEKLADPSDADKMKKDATESRPRETSDSSEKSPNSKPPDKSDPSPAKPKSNDSPDKTTDKPNSANPSDSKPSEPQPSPSSSERTPPSDPQSTPSQPSPSKSSSDEDSQSTPDSSPNSKPSSDQQSPPQSPEETARKRVKQAEDRMRKAQGDLENGQRAEAIKKQKEAERELRAASEELERILRQLREEEIERSLKSLESRFRRMLEMQKVVLEESERLSQLTGELRDRQLEIGSSKLSLEERKILMEGQRAMLLLQEEGSSMAFPEAVQQMQGDIQSVTDRLAATDIGPITISIEQEIVSALEEMIDSLTQVQKNRDKAKQQQQAQQSGQNQQKEDQPLVDALAELRLVKTLQLRVNTRTQRLSAQLGNASDPVGQATDAQLKQQLRELAQRQEKIQAVTRDIVITAQAQSNPK